MFYPTGASPQYELDKVKVLIKKAGIINNTQVCMFVANIMQQSEYLSLSGSSWNLNDNMERAVFKDTIYKDQNKVIW